MNLPDMKSLIKQASLTFFFTLIIISCNTDKLPPSDPDNGGLFFPDGFEARVVVDSIGRARHLAVNENGDIYVKLTYNDKMKGKGGSVALRDMNTVSYTHLDVYKRQVLIWALQSNFQYDGDVDINYRIVL